MGWDQIQKGYHPIELLYLPNRIYNALVYNGIGDIPTLTALTRKELLTKWSIGPYAVDQIKKALKKQGLCLKR